MNEELRRFIADIEREGDGLPRDLHITRMCCSLVAVSNGRVIKLTDPKLEHCPLASSLYHLPDGLDAESLRAKIAEAVEWKISEFGLFTDLRCLHRSSIAIPFGASEMMMYDLKRGRADAAVVVCDGAGTVIAEDPYLVQGIGARMNGVFYTSPIDGVIKGIEGRGGEVLSPEEAKIDQVAGVKRALERHRSVDVTVSGFGDDSLGEIRELEAEHGASVTILVVCTTGIGEERVMEAKEYADLVWSCASGGGEGNHREGCQAPDGDQDPRIRPDREGLGLRIELLLKRVQRIHKQIRGAIHSLGRMQDHARCVRM
jgi:putative methanogenesis marker protein 8